MKKIKFIPLILIAIALITTSCAIDDDDALVPANITTKTVSFADAEIFVPSSATPFDLSVFVDQAFGTSALVEYTMNGAADGTTIRFGNTVGNIPVDVSENGSVIYVTLTNVSVLNKPDTVDAVIAADNKTVKIIVLDTPATNPSALQVVLSWDNGASDDLDLYITVDPPSNPAANWLERSWTVTPIEMVSFDTFNSDGTYNVLVDDTYNFSPSSDQVGIYLAVVHTDGTIEYFSDTITGGSGFYYFVQIEKVGNAFTLNQVPATPI